jgi:hypothetical protein
MSAIMLHGMNLRIDMFLSCLLSHQLACFQVGSQSQPLQLSRSSCILSILALVALASSPIGINKRQTPAPRDHSWSRQEQISFPELALPLRSHRLQPYALSS